MLTPHELAIARTVVYASLFDYPLTLDQLHETLLEADLTPSEILAVFRSSEPLRRVVEYRNGFFFPSGRQDLVPERRRREARSHAFLEKHRWLVGVLCAVPYTRLVALSGSIAHFNMEPDGDLDLFIVTRGRRVWSVTTAVLVLARLLGQRRIVCVNFVVSDSRLAVEQQDVFVANQLIHLRPLVGSDVFAKLLAANRFVTRIYPNFRLGTQRPVTVAAPRGLAHLKSAIEVVFAVPSRLAEVICRAGYGWRLRSRSTLWHSPEQVRMDADYLKLHTQSHRQSILERFDAAVGRAIEEAEDHGRAPVPGSNMARHDDEPAVRLA